VGRLLDLDDFLDPKSLTPQQLYKLQSETWAQGADYERERILGLRKEIINCVVDYGLMPETYLRVMRDLEELIKGEQK